MEIASPSLPGFRKMALLARTERGGHVKLWRHLCSTDEAMYVMRVEQGKAPKNSQKYVRWNMRTVKGLFGTVIREIDEVVCPRWMLEAKLGDDERANTALKFTKIAWMIEEAGESLVTDSHLREQLIKEAAKLAKVKQPYIRALLTRYYYYAGHENALMSLNRFKCAPGVSRFDITSKKMGRPNDNVVLNPRSSFTGRNMTRYYLHRWIEVLQEEFALGNNNVSAAYEKLLLRLRGKNRNARGEVVSYPVDPKKLPEKALFLRYGSRIVQKLRLKRKQMGELQWRQKYAAQRGHAEDLAHNVIDIYDFDGTEFNIEVLFGKKLKHVGKPCVLLAIERRSRAVVGWYVWLGRENGFAYKYCLFNAFTPKEERLIKYKVAHLRGFVYGACEQAFFDRGPGISTSVSKAITERIRVDALITKPRDGGGKAVVENVIGRFEKELAEMPGGFWRADSIKDKDKHAKAERHAAITFEQFMYLLLNAISDTNLYMDVKELLTREMLENKVAPNPKAIFLWNRSQRRGDATYEWPEELIYKRLLERHEVLAPKGVVTIGGSKYRSAELSDYYEHWNGGPHGKEVSPTIVVYELHEDTDYLLWERADGSLRLLECMARSKLQYDGAEQWVRSYINRLKNAAAREQRVKEARQATLSRAKEETMRQVDGLPRTRPTKGEKRKNRTEANAAIVGEDLAEKFQMLGVPRNLNATDGSARNDEDLIGYQSWTSADEVVDTDW